MVDTQDKNAQDGADTQQADIIYPSPDGTEAVPDGLGGTRRKAG